MQVKRLTPQTSFDGLSHRMIDFEHGEYVRYADYHALYLLAEEMAEKFNFLVQQSGRCLLSPDELDSASEHLYRMASNRSFELCAQVALAGFQKWEALNAQV